MSRFTSTETVKLDLSEGDYIVIKAKLSYGEQQRLSGAVFSRLERKDEGDADIGIDMERFGIERLKVRLVEWSFRDEKGKVVPVSASTIAALDPATVAEIDQAIDEYLKAQEKNDQKTSTPTT